MLHSSLVLELHSLVHLARLSLHVACSLGGSCGSCSWSFLIVNYVRSTWSHTGVLEHHVLAFSEN